MTPTQTEFGAGVWAYPTRTTKVGTLTDPFTGVNGSPLSAFWTIQNGQWEIDSNSARAKAGFTANAQAVWQSPYGGDGIVTVTIGTMGSQCGLVIRMTDKDNGYVWDVSAFGMSIYRRVAAADTTLYTTGVGFASGDVLMVWMKGPTLKFYKNGTLLRTETQTFNQTATRHGLWQNGSTATRFDSAVIQGFQYPLNERGILAQAVWEYSTRTANPAGGSGTPIYLSGTLTGSGGISGVPTVTRRLAGTTLGAGAVAGAPRVTRSLGGTLTGTGATSASVTVQRLLSGTLAGAGVVGGVPQVTRLLSGILQGAGATSATVTVQRLLSGILTGRGSTSGTLAGSPIYLSGILGGRGSISGEPTVTRNLAGTTAGAGALSGAPEVQRLLSGTLAGQGALSGAPEVTRILAGILIGRGATSGQLSAEIQIALLRYIATLSWIPKPAAELLTISKPVAEWED